MLDPSQQLQQVQHRLGKVGTGRGGVGTKHVMWCPTVESFTSKHDVTLHWHYAQAPFHLISSHFFSVDFITP